MFNQRSDICGALESGNACVFPSRIAEANISTCPATAGSQALCLEGDTNWLLQNADGIGFVNYCGWAPYRRPLHDPNFRNDTDCRAVMQRPEDDFVGGCASAECQSLEECVARCDLCANCSAVLYNSRGGTAIRCHMQSNVYVESLQSAAFPVPWSFYVNERNEGCHSVEEVDILGSRGVRGFRLFADLGCSKELVPDQVFALDGGGLVRLEGLWVPRCALAGHCYAGGVSLMATFNSPQVVRCALVDAKAPDKFSRGWRLAKNSAELSGLLKDLAQAEWLEVARSGASLGVRASWDGITEVNVSSPGGGSLDAWDAQHRGMEGASNLLSVLSILVALLAGGLCLLAGAFLYIRPLVRGPSRPIRLEGRVPPIMLPPAAVRLEEEGLRLDHIEVSAGILEAEPDQASEQHQEAPRLAFAGPDAFAQLQALLDFTHLSARTAAAGEEAEKQPIAGVQLRQALQIIQDTSKSRRYAQQCAAIRRKRTDLKPLTPELLSAAAVAKLDLADVIMAPDAAVNESYLWYHGPVRHVLALAQGRWGEMAKGAHDGICLTESCAEVDSVPAEAAGHYAGVRALLLCRLCVGKFCYMAEWGPEARREVDSGEFDSILEDNAARRVLVFSPEQVCPEFLVLCSQIGGSEEHPLAPLALELPIYWNHLARDPISAPFRQLQLAAPALGRRLLTLAGPCQRHVVRQVRCLEHAQLWLRYASHRKGSRSTSADAEVVSGDLLTNEALLWLESDQEVPGSRGHCRRQLPHRRRLHDPSQRGSELMPLPRTATRRSLLRPALPGVPCTRCSPIGGSQSRAISLSAVCWRSVCAHSVPGGPRIPGVRRGCGGEGYRVIPM
ncbi:unnamed protein product [Symbiodinium natans]|uniref:Uncharacterized protein n=1 Tax=Symbiodinium natans TaxID=878477 RepID=A0A812SAN4_9DINO|nr:unnamed protein product [Symbiodinium natans]